MTKIDIISGFLGAGKTTFIKKLLQEAISGEQVVLIENEFGEIGIDGGFLKDSGIEIREMNSGCICCSLVGDFGTSLKEVISTYAPERILIEPSGVGKLSDVLKAVENVAGDLDVEINSAVAVVDASKCKMYMKNFGEFFSNQIEYAGTIILSRTDKVDQAKLNACVEMIREHNDKATIITTPLDQLDGREVLKTIEGADKLEDMMKEMLEHIHDDHDEDECCDHEHHHHHDHDEDDNDHECCCGHHHDDDDDEDEHEHHHDHDKDHDHENVVVAVMITIMSTIIMTMMMTVAVTIMTMSIIMSMTRTAPAAATIMIMTTTIITITQTKYSPVGVSRHPTPTAQRTSRRSLLLWTAESTVQSCVPRVWYPLPTEPGYIMIMFPKSMTSEAVSRKLPVRSVSSVPNWTRTSWQNCSVNKLPERILQAAG